MDEDLGSPRAHEQHGAAQRVPVAVELLGAHGAEQVAEDAANVAVDALQGYVQAQPGSLVHEGLQAPDVWQGERGQRDIGRHSRRERDLLFFYDI